MLDDINGPRLMRYVSGECTPAEAIEIQNWVAEDPAREELLDTLQELWRVSGAAGAGWDVDTALAKLVATSGASRAPTSRPATSRFAASSARASRAARHRQWGWPAHAAAAAVLVLAGGLVWQLAIDRRSPEAATERTEWVTPRRQQARLTFDDGTTVLLGPESRLRLRQAHRTDSREFELEGEASFDVAHDVRRPFRVHTRHGIAEDLGTKFVVRAHATDEAVQVVVEEGSVALHPDGTTAAEPAVLARGDLGRMTAAGEATVTRGVDLDPYLAWREGRLVFKNTPFKEALPELDRWYDLDSRIADPALGELLLTATVRRNEPLNEVLRLVALSLGLGYEREGRTVTFSSR